jgi:hypothetical protein
MLLHKPHGFAQEIGPKAVADGDFDRWLEPDLGFPFCMLDVNVSTSLLAREEVEAESADPKHRWAHSHSINPIPRGRRDRAASVKRPCHVRGDSDADLLASAASWRRWRARHRPRRVGHDGAWPTTAPGMANP